MKDACKLNNKRDFFATCPKAEVKENNKVLYKHVNIVVKQTLIYWKHSGRISQRNGFINDVK